MAAFPPDADIEHPVDFDVIRDGGVVAVRHGDELARAERALLRLHYAVVPLDAGGWVDPSTMHREIAVALEFPDYYGRNLDALDDCLYDVAHGDYGWNSGNGERLQHLGQRPESAGLCVSVANFDVLVTVAPRTASIVARSFSDATRTALLFGHRIVWLLQLEEPGAAVTIDPGVSTVPWRRIWD